MSPLAAAIYAVANQNLPIPDRVRAARFLWEAVSPAADHPLTGLIVGHVNQYLAGIGADKAVPVPATSADELNDLLGRTRMWLYQRKYGTGWWLRQT